MTEVSIFLSNEDLYYRYGNNVYNLSFLDRVLSPDNYLNNVSSFIPVSEIISKFTSRPLILKLRKDNIVHTVFATSGPNQTLNVITLESLEPLDLYILPFMYNAIIPNPTQSDPNPNILEDLNTLPNFDPEVQRRLNDLQDQNFTYPRVNIIQVGVNPLRQSGLPVIEFDLVRHIIGSVVRFEINPEFQQFATPGNNVITLFTRPGLNYVVLARYDPTTHQIFPPV